MSVDLFAGIAVRDFVGAVAWYERLFGVGPAFLPHDTEAVWEVGEHRYVNVVQMPEHAGHARHTLFVSDLDGVVTRGAARGIEPARQETYENGVRKISYRDPDGNEIAYGGGPS